MIPPLLFEHLRREPPPGVTEVAAATRKVEGLEQRDIGQLRPDELDDLRLVALPRGDVGQAGRMELV